MIKQLRVVVFLFFAVLMVNACRDEGVTYAEELKVEKELIADFISRQNIQVVKTMPTTFPWPDKVFYKSKTGLYFRLLEQGDITSGDSIEGGDLVVPRYLDYSLVANNPDTIDKTTTIEAPYPDTFVYLNREQACLGWHEAVGYMKRNNSKATIIVYSKIGFSQYTKPATPRAYDISIKIRKY